LALPGLHENLITRIACEAIKHLDDIFCSVRKDRAVKKFELPRDHTMKNILVAAVVGALTLHVSFAVAQNASSVDSAGQASSDETTKTTKKTKPAKQTKTAAAKSGSKPGQYATEAQAKAACHGATVVWIASDHFSHYPGSREYGRKPGAYACEQ
jgi:hypothetical protein